MNSYENLSPARHGFASPILLKLSDFFQIFGIDLRGKPTENEKLKSRDHPSDTQAMV